MLSFCPMPLCLGTRVVDTAKLNTSRSPTPYLQRTHIEMDALGKRKKWDVAHF